MGHPLVRETEEVQEWGRRSHEKVERNEKESGGGGLLENKVFSRAMWTFLQDGGRECTVNGYHKREGIGGKKVRSMKRGRGDWFQAFIDWKRQLITGKLKLTKKELRKRGCKKGVGTG